MLTSEGHLRTITSDSRQHRLLGPYHQCAYELSELIGWHRHLQPRAPWIHKLESRFRQRLITLRLLQCLGWRSAPVSLSHSLRSLLSLIPLEPRALIVARQLLTSLNRDALSELEALRATASRPLMAIVSCRALLPTANRTLNSFLEWQSREKTAPIIVIGDPRLPDWRFRFSCRSRILTLPVSDSYEALPRKVMTLFLVASLLTEPPPVLKLDDDAHPADARALEALLDKLGQERPSAAGYPIFTPSPLHLDRAWHVGKSARANLRTFDSLGTERWMSGGVGYLLNGKAVNLLADYSLHSWGFVRSMLYEDVCVSMLLQASRCPIQWISDPSDLGIKNERQHEIHQGQWLVPEGLR